MFDRVLNTSLLHQIYVTKFNSYLSDIEDIDHKMKRRMQRDFWRFGGRYEKTEMRKKTQEYDDEDSFTKWMTIERALNLFLSRTITKSSQHPKPYGLDV